MSGSRGTNELLPVLLHRTCSNPPFETSEGLPHTSSLLFPTSTSKTSFYRVLLGARQLVKPGPHATYSRVKRVESNPLYQGMASSADVALVELEAPVTFTNYILPVCMPDPSIIFESGMECWATGWGSPSEQGNGAGSGKNGGHAIEKVRATLNQQSFSVDIGTHDHYSNGRSWYGKRAADAGGDMGKWRDDRKNPAWCMNKGRILFHKALSEERSKPKHNIGRDGAVLLKNCPLS